MIDYAIRNSELISEDSVIYKATGRAFLRNSNNVIKSKDTAFIAKNKIGWVNTEFFKISKDLYFSCLSCGIELMDDYEQKNIERVWYNLLKKSVGKDTMKISSFKCFPRLSGVIGSAQNKRYDKSGF